MSHTDAAVAPLRARIVELEAENARLREGLRLALLWLPDPEMHATMSPGARAQLEAIRAAAATGGTDADAC